MRSLIALTVFWAYVVATSLHDKGNLATGGAGVFNISDEEALERARQVLSAYPLVDGHNDLPWQYRRRVQNNIRAVNLSYDVTGQWGSSHTDIPRLREGLLGAQFWAIFISCVKQYQDAVRATLEQVDVTRRFIQQYPDDFELVTTAQGIEDAFAAGKIGGLLGLEGGHSLDSSFASLRILYELGVRYLGVTHNCDLPWATAQNTASDDGLTSFGEDMIAESNRLGMLLDLSHASHETMRDTLRVSLAPVMFSHSNAYALCNHQRNVPDDVLQSTAENGGIVMITFVGGFLTCAPSNDRERDVHIVADHIEYIRDLIGVDYVGIGGDYDGTFGLPEGLEDVSKYPNLFAELVKRGWSNENLEKLAGRNLVRVFRRVEDVRDGLRDLDAHDAWIPDEDIEGRSQCRTED